MSTPKPKQRSIRYTADDLRVVARLRELTGCSAAAIIRIAIREMLASREAPLQRTGT